MSYAREPTGPEWVLVADVAWPGTCDFDRSGCRIRIDFSPKGGPRDVIAIWSPTKNAIQVVVCRSDRSLRRFFDRLIDSSIG